jgi:hypothetical protein
MVILATPLVSDAPFEPLRLSIVPRNVPSRYRDRYVIRVPPARRRRDHETSCAQVTRSEIAGPVCRISDATRNQDGRLLHGARAENEAHIGLKVGPGPTAERGIVSQTRDIDTPVLGEYGVV